MRTDLNPHRIAPKYCSGGREGATGEAPHEQARWASEQRRAGLCPDVGLRVPGPQLRPPPDKKLDREGLGG